MLPDGEMTLTWSRTSGGVTKMIDELGLIPGFNTERQKVRARLLQISGPYRRILIGNLKATSGESLINDPYMPKIMKTFWRAFNEVLWRGIDEEVERSLEGYMFSDVRHLLAAPVRDNTGNIFRWTRAKVLYHYHPFDKTIWGKLHDPVYLFMLGVQALPFYGIRVIFFSIMLIFHTIDPKGPDQYQLLNFILTFKSTQIFTSGLVSMTIGSSMYFCCYSFASEGNLVQCIENYGPGSLSGDLTDFIGSIFLVWMAFFLLPVSHRGPHVPGNRDYRDHRKHASANAFQCSSVFTQQHVHGWLMRWDILAVVIVVCWFLIVVYLSTGQFALDMEHPKCRAAVYWAKVFYAMLSVPFAVFNVPYATALLTHLDPTGYRDDGEVVHIKIASDRANQCAAGACCTRSEEPVLRDNAPAEAPLTEDPSWAEPDPGWTSWLWFWNYGGDGGEEANSAENNSNNDSRNRGTSTATSGQASAQSV